jgi:ribose transport system ATP-binding protein
MRLSIRNASKTFGSARVLNAVDLDVRGGEIHGLIGQNGSGKSTLIKLLSGFHTADQGSSFLVDGEELSLPIRPSELQRRGVAFVHQDLGLVANASVVENVKVGRYTVGTVSRRIRWETDAAEVSAVLDELGSGDIDPFALVSTLTHGQRASVAIARAILGTSAGAGCVVFDESTQSLPREILHDFYGQVRRLAAAGTAILIVSHRLDEVLALCDRVTVLEDGCVTVEGRSTVGLTEPELTRLILGGSARARAHAGSDAPRSAATLGEVVLEASVSGGAIRDAGFAVRAGEVVGVIGNSESGFDQLPYLLCGADDRAVGTVTVDGRTAPLQTLTPGRAARLGIGFVPGKRADEGLALALAAFENVSLPRVSRRGHRLFLGRRWQEAEFRESVADLGVTPADPALLAGEFSGGNQQKMLLSKWLLNGPRVLVLHEPTQAVDVGARADILAAIRARAAAGLAVIVVSLETDDLAAVCDRVLILRTGSLHRELGGDGLTAHAIIDAAYGDLDVELTRNRA